MAQLGCKSEKGRPSIYVGHTQNPGSWQFLIDFVGKLHVNLFFCLNQNAFLGRQCLSVVELKGVKRISKKNQKIHIY